MWIIINNRRINLDLVTHINVTKYHDVYTLHFEFVNNTEVRIDIDQAKYARVVSILDNMLHVKNIDGHKEDLQEQTQNSLQGASNGKF